MWWDTAFQHFHNECRAGAGRAGDSGKVSATIKPLICQLQWPPLVFVEQRRSESAVEKIRKLIAAATVVLSTLLVVAERRCYAFGARETRVMTGNFC